MRKLLIPILLGGLLFTSGCSQVKETTFKPLNYGFLQMGEVIQPILIQPIQQQSVETAIQPVVPNTKNKKVTAPKTIVKIPSKKYNTKVVVAKEVPEKIVETPIFIPIDTTLKMSLTLYTSDDQGYLFSKKMIIQQTDAQGIWNMLVDEPKGVKVLDYSVVNGIGYLDLSKEFTATYTGGSNQGMIYVYEAVNTFCSIDGVKGIQFLVDGKKIDILFEMDNRVFTPNY